MLEFADQGASFTAPQSPPTIDSTPASTALRDLAEARRKIAEFVQNGLPLPDELQEATLLLELAVTPFNLALTRSLVAVRYNLGKPPFPDRSDARGSSGPVKPDAIRQLLRQGTELSREGDVFWDYACLWQIVLRYPRSPRGWAEYARRFAQRRDWANCRLVAEKVLRWPRRVDRSSAVVLLEALETLALNGQITGARWQGWLSTLPKALRSNPSAARLQLCASKVKAAEFVQNGLPLPDELQEATLLLELAVTPFDLALTRSLVAVRHNLGKPPFPDRSDARGSSGPVKPDAIRQLLRQGTELSREGDVFWDYACLWQIVLRYPRSPRGWAEYARRFAQRRDWANCRLVAEKMLRWPRRVDRSSAVVLLEALETLALNGQITGLRWQGWLSTLPKALCSYPSAVGLKLWVGDAKGAMAQLPSILQTPRPSASGWIMAAHLAFEQEQWYDAYQYWRRAFDTDLPVALRSAFNDHPGRLSHILRVTGKADELADWLTEQWVGREGINLIPPTASPESEWRTRELRDRALERGLPSVLMAAQAKSGSASIARLFNSGFGLPGVVFSLITDAIVAAWLSDYLRGGAAHITHLLPTERNIALLAASGAPRIIVHLRDPRQLVVSFAGHVTKYPSLTAPSYRVNGRGLREAIAATLDHQIGDVVGWIDGWVGARDRLQIEFTTFEEFVRDRDAFIDRVLSLYGGDHRYFDRENGLREHSGIDYHRRVGRTDEWREVLSRDQIERVNRAIPDRLWNLFGWQP